MYTFKGPNKYTVSFEASPEHAQEIFWALSCYWAGDLVTCAKEGAAIRGRGGEFKFQDRIKEHVL